MLISGKIRLVEEKLSSNMETKGVVAAAQSGYMQLMEQINPMVFWEVAGFDKALFEKCSKDMELSRAGRKVYRLMSRFLVELLENVQEDRLCKAFAYGGELLRVYELPSVKANTSLGEFYQSRFSAPQRYATDPLSVDIDVEQFSQWKPRSGDLSNYDFRDWFKNLHMVV